MGLTATRVDGPKRCRLRRTAREAAEAAASKAADEANALKGAVDEAKRRFEDVTRQAEELMRVK